MTSKPKWAVNAANRFVIPSSAKCTNEEAYAIADGWIFDIEKLHDALVALQLRAYKRGQREVDTAAMNRESARNRKDEIFRAGENVTAGAIVTFNAAGLLMKCTTNKTPVGVAGEDLIAGDDVTFNGKSLWTAVRSR